MKIFSPIFGVVISRRVRQTYVLGLDAETEGYGRGGSGIISRIISVVARDVREHAPADVSSSRRDFTVETGSTPTKAFASRFTAVGWMQQLDHNCVKAL